MTQENSPSHDPQETSKERPAEPGTPRKRRRWLKIVAILVVLLIVLVLLLPTIASLGFVRSIVLGKVNQNLNGKLQIDGWSLGWFSGAQLRDVKLLDPDGEKVATIDKVTTQLSVLDVLRGNYDLGNTNIEGCEFWVRLDKNGQTNLAKLPKKHAKKTTIQEAPQQLPDVTGQIHLTAKGHVEVENAPAGVVNLTGEIPAHALVNIASQKPPGATGKLDLSWTVPNLQNLAQQWTGAVSLLPDVKITGGQFDQSTHVDIRENDLFVSNRLTFSAEGTRDGKPIKLDKIEISKADATLDPTKQSLAALGNLTVNINSPYFTMTGGGSSLNALNINGKFNLDLLQQQLSQFVDLHGLKLTGTGTIQINSTADQTHLAINTNDGKNEVIDLDLYATGIEPSTMTVKHFDNELNVMDLASAQQQLDPFMPFLKDNDLRITAGALYTNVSGSIDGQKRTIRFDPGNPLELTTPGLTIQKTTDDGKSIDVLKDERIAVKALGFVALPADGPMSASIKTLAIDTQHKILSVRKAEGADLSFKMDDNSIGGVGSVTLSADVKAIKDIASRLGGEAEFKKGSAGQLTSGQLDATLALSSAQNDTTVKLDGKIVNISVTTWDPKKPISNETVTIALTAVAKNDMSGATASGTIDSSFANVNLKQAELSLKDKSLEKAQLTVAAPDLAKLDAVAMAFVPPPAPTHAKGEKPQPAPEASSPIQVTSGSATLALNVARDPSAPAGLITSLNGDGSIDVPEVTVSGMQIQKLVIPMTMQKGVFRTVYKDKPEGKNTAPPATCNGGTIDLSNISLDLSKDTPRLTVPVSGKGRRIIQNVSINPALGDTLGKFVNPVFANSKQAKGLLDITITKCNDLAIGDKMYGVDSGSLRVVFSLSDMDITNPMGSLLVGGVLKQFKLPTMPAGEADIFRGQIRDAVVSLDKGVANTDITLSLIDPAVADVQSQSSKKKGSEQAGVMPLHFWGNIQMSNLAQDLNATIPPRLIGKFITSIPFVKINDPTQALVAAFPNGIPVAVKGTTVDPQFDFGDIGQQFIGGFLKGGNSGAVKEGQDILNQVLGGKEKSKDRNK